jgi:hypothetical protein
MAHVQSDDDRVMSFDQWCATNGFSRSTGLRICKAGNGPQFIRLSLRRKGVTRGENRRWQESRRIDRVAS